MDKRYLIEILNENKMLSISRLQSENENECFEDSILSVLLGLHDSSLEWPLKILTNINDKNRAIFYCKF